jgi:hypothetical protein
MSLAERALPPERRPTLYPTLLKETLANVEQRIAIALVLNKGGDLKLMESVLSMFTLRDILRKEQFARP